MNQNIKKWVTSDLHFGHANIIKYCPKTRGHFSSIDEMNNFMIKEWNESVGDNDEVYILGDISFYSVEKTVAILDQLKGKKILIEGNHDYRLVKENSFRSRFKEIHKYYTMKHKGTTVVMFHFPIFHWDQMHYGSVHFHGHVHGSGTGLEEYRIRDVGYDCTGKVVTSFDDMVADALKGKLKNNH